MIQVRVMNNNASVTLNIPETNTIADALRAAEEAEPRLVFDPSKTVSLSGDFYAPGELGKTFEQAGIPNGGSCFVSLITKSVNA